MNIQFCKTRPLTKSEKEECLINTIDDIDIDKASTTRVLEAIAFSNDIVGIFGEDDILIGIMPNKAEEKKDTPTRRRKLRNGTITGVALNIIKKSPGIRWREIVLKAREEIEHVREQSVTSALQCLKKRGDICQNDHKYYIS